MFTIVLIIFIKENMNYCYFEKTREFLIYKSIFFVKDTKN